MEVEFTSETILANTRVLIDVWCDRRCYSALRNILQGFPLSSPLTDGWGQLLDAMQSVRAFVKDELFESELLTLNELIAAVSKLVYR